jgi:parvulin-like peptidyl-prolyl isomerase
MDTLVTIEGHKLTSRDFINYLKLNNEFDDILERIIREKAAIVAAEKKGLSVSVDELQETADNLRRHVGLHRAKDTQEWLDSQSLTVDDLEEYVRDMVMTRKLQESIITDEAIDAYFQQHSPKFDQIDYKLIVVDSGDKAREITALLEDDPDMFSELLEQHSVDEETRGNDGLMKGIRRGILSDEVEPRLFNADEGDIVGPIQLGDSDFYEIYVVLNKQNATLTDHLRDEVGDTLYREWVDERINEISIDFG